MSAHSLPTRRMTVPEFVEVCKSDTPTVMITAYDMTSAMFAEAGGVDAILVGDSLASVIRGEPNTRKVSVDEIIYHTKIVVCHTQRPLIIADMPYGDFQCSAEEARRAAVRIWRETDCGAIKVEGGVAVASHVKAIINECEIPVMGHVGMRPQAAGIYGGFKAQGKTMLSRRKIMEDALAMQEAGCFSLVVEAVDLSLAEEILAKVKIPVIGIGASPKCHGQVLVFHDVVGLTQGNKAKFVRCFGNAAEVMTESVRSFAQAVRGHDFPSADECYHLKIVSDEAPACERRPLLYGPNGKPLALD